MKACGIIAVAVLLFVGTVQAVSTISALSSKGLTQIQAGQIGPPGPWDGGIAGEQGYPLQMLSGSEGLFSSESPVCCDLPTFELGESATCPAEAVEDAPEQLAADVIDSLGADTQWRTDRHWNTIARTSYEAGFVGAGSIVLPAFDEGRWILTPLPTTRESFIMEFIVFPTLAAMMLILATRLLMLRVRRRRSRSRNQQLLQV